MNAQQLARDLLAHFIYKEERKAWFHDDDDERAKALAMAAHGDFMPDDWRYAFLVEALQMIDDAGDDPDLDELADEIEPDIYTGQLTAWLASNINRVAYCDDAVEEREAHPASLFELLLLGQLQERLEVYHAVKDWLLEYAGEEEEEEEEEDSE